ncbi:MAG: pyridine nucleotide-disulfide oxidoreductase [Boseongicola sp.]|nr:MAG: pyridine nucleotide-disulfide oxidoreductase [Boseongicola sp.]
MTDTDADQNVIVIGAGQAGLAAAAKLRVLGHRGKLTMIGAEPYHPYQRPPLSKAYLLGDMTRERLFLRPPAFYDENHIDMRLGTHVTRIDRDAKSVTLSDGGQMTYDKLILTTGAEPVRLPDAIVSDLGGVFYMRDLKDADAIAEVMTPGRRVLVVGGGYIGLEGAAVACKLGMHVTLVEAGARILNRVAASETANFFRSLHRANRVDLRENIGLVALHGNKGQVQQAKLSDGTIIACDLVLVGIGVRPRQNVAEEAGLVLDNGIKTNCYGQTSDDSIYAAGDCASFPWMGRRIRLESVGNAIDQAEIVAANVLGQGLNYVAAPWFWSDQYDVKLQIAGLSTGYDNVIIRRTDANSVSHWYFADQRLIAIDALNDPRSYMVAKRLIEAGKTPDPALVKDPKSDLKALLKS